MKPRITISRRVLYENNGVNFFQIDYEAKILEKCDNILHCKLVSGFPKSSIYVDNGQQISIWLENNDNYDYLFYHQQFTLERDNRWVYSNGISNLLKAVYFVDLLEVDDNFLIIEMVSGFPAIMEHYMGGIKRDYLDIINSKIPIWGGESVLAKDWGGNFEI